MALYYFILHKKGIAGTFERVGSPGSARGRL